MHKDGHAILYALTFALNPIIQKNANGMIKNWIDWMKVLGMFAIIWGHCFPQLFSDFLYAFNVPLFFFISGYLSKKESQNSIFWSKLLKRLWIPYLILSLLKAAPHLINHDAPWSLLGIITGFHTFNDVLGCGKLWFVYTLILLKILFQYADDKKSTKIVLLLISLAGAIGIPHYIKEELSWSFTNAFLAMPWFLFGQEYHLGKYDTRFFGSIIQLKMWKKYILVFFLLIAIYIVSYNNGRAYMYIAEYGNSIILFLIGGLLGIFCIRLISDILNKYTCHSLRLLSIGTIVTLAYHMDVNHPLLKFVRQQEWLPLFEDIATFFCSVITLLVFIPIIYIISRYIPFVIGNRNIN